MAEQGLPRVLEAPMATLALVLLSPLLLLVALAVALSSRGPVLFRQQRIGREGEEFTFYKFRSMRIESGGVLLTASGDSRVTAVGRVIRKLKLDELPELWNVIKGDLSLVGPRPEVPRYVDLSDPLWQEVLKARPGLTDPVTLRLRNEEELLGALEGDPELFYRLYLLPFKLRGYRSYLRDRSWRSDLWVLWNTLLGVVFPGRNPPPTSEELARLWGPEDRVPALDSAPKGSFFGRHLRQLQFLLDLGVLAGAFVLAYLLRFDFAVPGPERSRMLVQLPVVLVLQLAAFLMAGIHNFVWRYVSLSEVHAFVRAAIGSAVPLVLLRLGLAESFQSWRVPLSVIVMDTALAFGGLLGLRVLRRMSYERRQRLRRARAAAGQAKPVLLVGAGQAGVLAIRELQSRGEARLEIKGLVDDDPGKHGTVIRGVRVLGSTEDLPRLVTAQRIRQVIITIAEASPLELSRILEICHKIPVPARIIPGLYQILDGSVEVNREGVATAEAGSG
ncbi:MAG: sugar transferase [Acidobacteria bacterium]|nr:sugar transferase [Acidobacteriota bacterium]